MLIQNVEVAGAQVDVRIRDGRIDAISAELPVVEGEVMVDGQGGALLPGLHDHHIHLNATAAALNSLRCGPPEVQNEDQFVAVLNGQSGAGWLRGIGYHPSVAGEIDRNWLDRHGPDRPIRIQHRSGRLWILNSAALALLDLEKLTDGRLLDGDAIVRKSLGGQRPDLQPLIRKLHSYGITGVTEVTPGNDREDLAHYCEAARPLNICIMGGADLHAVSGDNARVIGPLKIHNHDHDLPPLADLVREIGVAHDHGRAVAIHCVTRAELMLSLAAIEEAGPLSGDRIEHGAIVDAVGIDWIKRLGLTVVTQPHFVTERGEAYLRDVDADDLPHLWRLKSFSDAGINLAAGSDAPFGDFNPWSAMANAVKRPDDLGAEEAVSADMALALYTKPVANAGGNARKIVVGESADLCLLDRTWSEASHDLAAVNVHATWVAGEPVYDRISSINPHSSAV
ncbi:MAG: amidohydrolase family protein [Sphingorhabdus sp.]